MITSIIADIIEIQFEGCSAELTACNDQRSGRTKGNDCDGMRGAPLNTWTCRCARHRCESPVNTLFKDERLHPGPMRALCAGLLMRRNSTK